MVRHVVEIHHAHHSLVNCSIDECETRVVARRWAPWVGHLVPAFWSSVELPTMVLLDAISERLGLGVQFRDGMGGIAE